MPAGKGQQAPKSASVKSKEKNFLDLNEIRRLIQKSAPKYNDRLYYEVIYYIIVLTSITCQYLHIYRLNFYNYDFKLYLYSLLILLRRLLFKFRQEKEITDPLENELSSQILKYCTYLWGYNLLYLTYQLVAQYTWSSIFFLFYFHIIIVLSSFFFYKEQRYDNVVNEMNHIFKSILFRSLEIIYFILLLPLKCHDENLSYDLYTSIFVGFMGLFNSIIYSVFFTVCYRGEEMYKQAKTLGDWKQITIPQDKRQHAEEWSLSRAPYKRDAIVTFGKKYYIGVAKSNAAVPGNMQFKLIYWLFNDHRATRVLLIIIMSISLVLQNLFIISSSKGSVYILIVIQSFFVFFCMIKFDRRINKQFD